MRRLSTLGTPGGQRGAVAITVALLMVALLGLTAVSVDVGTLWMDKKELQNGADAAALALAQSCANGDCEDDGVMADLYAEGNKRDAEIDKVDVAGNTLSDGYVTVSVESERDHWFAPIFGPGSQSTTVSASATAAWGLIKGADVLPITVSDCALDLIEKNEVVRFEIAKKSPSPKEKASETPTPSPSASATLEPEAAACPEYTSGPHIIPGGFGWLEVSDGTKCLVGTSVDNIAPSDPGKAGPTGGTYPACDALLSDLENRYVLVPLYDHAASSGAGGEFTIVAYAHLLIETYCLNKGQGWYHVPDGKCTASSSSDDGKFITGKLVERVALGAELDLGGTGEGSTTVQLTK